MTNYFTEENSAETVIAAMSDDADPRLREVMAVIIRKLHEAVKEIEASNMLEGLTQAGDDKALALLLNTCNPIMAQGAAFAELPFMDRFEVDITQAFQTGDRLTVDPQAGLVVVEPHQA